MTIPKEIIEKAIEGGWKPEVVNWMGTPHSYLYEYKFALDPSFWQSLIKVIYDPLKTGQTYWRIIAEKFCHVVLTGGDTEKFWNELLN